MSGNNKKILIKDEIISRISTDDNGDIAYNNRRLLNVTDIPDIEANNNFTSLLGQPEDNTALAASLAAKTSKTYVDNQDTAVINQLSNSVPTDGNNLNKLNNKILALQALINGDDINLDSIKELADAIKSDEGLIAVLSTNKVNTSDIYNALDQIIAGKVLDARQGKTLNDLIAALTTTVGGKSDKLSPTAIKNAASAYTPVINDFVMLDTTSGGFTQPLPATPADKSKIGFKLVLTSSNNQVTLTCSGTTKFNTSTGGQSFTMYLPNHAVTFQYNVAADVYIITSNDQPPSAATLLPHPDSLDTTASTYHAPSVGGVNKRSRSIGIRTLCHIPTKADVFGTPAACSDVSVSDGIYGNTAMQLTSVANTVHTIAPLAANSVVTDVTGGIIKIWFKVISNVSSQLNKFSIELYSTGATPTTPGVNYHWLAPFTAENDFKAMFSNTTNGAGRWQSYSIPVAQFAAATGGSGADLTNIVFARWNLRSTATMSIQLGNIEFIPNKLTKAKCILRFDDGYLSHWTYVAPLLAKYGFPAIFFPSPFASTIGYDVTKMNIAQLKSLNIRGHQIGSQGYSTESNTIFDGWSENQQTSEFAKLRNIQAGAGLTGGDDGSWFSQVSFADPNVLNAFLKHFRTIQSFRGGNASGVPLPVGETYPFGDFMNIRALNGASWTDTTNGTQLQAHIDQTITNKGVAIIAWHDELGTAGNVRNGFISLLTYLDTHRSTIDVCTMEDLAAL